MSDRLRSDEEVMQDRINEVEAERDALRTQLDEAVELLTGITGKVGQSRYDIADVRAFLARLDQPGIDRHAYDKTILGELRKNGLGGTAMTAREHIIETMAAKVCPSSHYEGPCTTHREQAANALDAIPPALLWEWLIETGNIEQVGWINSLGSIGPMQMNHGVPVFRLVAETKGE